MTIERPFHVLLMSGFPEGILVSMKDGPFSGGATSEVMPKALGVKDLVRPDYKTQLWSSMTATSNKIHIIIMLLLCVVACVIGGYCAIYPKRAAQKWHSADLARIPAAKMHFYVLVYRAFGILYVIGSLIFATKSLLDSQVIK